MSVVPSRFRFSLLHFLIVVTLLAIGMGAFASSSRLAATGVYTIYIGLLCLAIAGAIAVKGERRPFWIGFAVFAWAYYLVGFETTSQVPAQRWAQAWNSSLSVSYYGNNAESASRLITTELIDFLEENLTGSRQVGSKVMAQWQGGSYYPGTIQQWDGTNYIVKWDDGSGPGPVPPAGIHGYTPYARVTGHSIFGGLAGLLGAILTALFFGGKQEGTEKT